MPEPAKLDREIVSALVAENGSRSRAAQRLGYPERTFARRLEGHAKELSELAKRHSWPPRTDAATRRAAELAHEARLARRRAGAATGVTRPSA